MKVILVNKTYKVVAHNDQFYVMPRDVKRISAKYLNGNVLEQAMESARIAEIVMCAKTMDEILDVFFE